MNRTYLVSDLASELHIPRTTVNDWLKIYAGYLESEMRGKRRVYPERTLNILQEIKSMREAGRGQIEVEQFLQERYGIRPEPVENVPQETEEIASSGKPSASMPPQAGKGNALALPDREFKEFFQRLWEQEQTRQAKGRKSALRLLAGTGGLLLLLILALFFTVLHFNTRLQHAEETAIRRQKTSDDAIAAAAQSLEEIRRLQLQDRQKDALHTAELQKLAVTLDKARQDYETQTARFMQELNRQKKEADKALEEIRKTEAGKREAESLKLKRDFAVQQQEYLKLLEEERAARRQKESEIRTLQEQMKRIQPSPPEKPEAPAVSAQPVQVKTESVSSLPGASMKTQPEGKK